MDINPALYALSKHAGFTIDTLRSAFKAPHVADDVVRYLSAFDVPLNNDDDGVYWAVPAGLQSPYYVNFDATPCADSATTDFVHLGVGSAARGVWGCAKHDAKRLRHYETLNSLVVLDQGADFDFSMITNASFVDCASHFYFLLGEGATLRLQLALTSDTANTTITVKALGSDARVALNGFMLNRDPSSFVFSCNETIRCDGVFYRAPCTDQELRTSIQKFPHEYAAELLAAFNFDL